MVGKLTLQEFLDQSLSKIPEDEWHELRVNIMKTKEGWSLCDLTSIPIPSPITYIDEKEEPILKKAKNATFPLKQKGE